MPFTMSPLYVVKTMIPMGIIHSHLDEHRVFILTEGEGVRIVAVPLDLTGMFMFVSSTELIYIHTHT